MESKPEVCPKSEKWVLVKIDGTVETRLATSSDIRPLKRKRDKMRAAVSDGAFHPHCHPPRFAVFAGDAMNIPYLERIAVGARARPIPERDLTDDWREGLKDIACYYNNDDDFQY